MLYRRRMSADAASTNEASTDGKRSRSPVALQRHDAKNFEARHVHAVYDAIAPHFSATRYKPWPNVLGFVQACRPGTVLLDVGCGNGKNLGLCAHVESIGCDYSGELLKLARARGHEAVRCDGMRLSYRDACVDAVLCVAVLHHFSTAERRAEAIREMARVLRPGGRALVYVWAVEQAKDRGGSDVMIDWEVHQNFDAEKPVLQRYYHLFRKGELEELVGSALHPEAITRSFFDKENWVVEFVKQ